MIPNRLILATFHIHYKYIIIRRKKVQLKYCIQDLPDPADNGFIPWILPGHSFPRTSKPP